MSRTALVTGAYGFLGRNAARYLSQSGYSVTGIGHGDWDSADYSRFGISFWRSCDVELDSLIEYGGDPDLVIHCAGGGSVGCSIENPHEDFIKTVVSTADVLEFARLHTSSAALVYPSSAAVYGDVARLPICEGVNAQPVSPYGNHKLLSEYLCKTYAATYGLRISIVRLFSLYGEGLRKQLLWDACNAFRRNRFSFQGTGRELRDWLHVEDGARLLSIAASYASPQCPVVNGGSGIGTSVGEVLEMLAREYGRYEKISFSGEIRDGDPEGYQAEISSARGWGWHPEICLSDGISKYASWFQENVK